MPGWRTDTSGSAAFSPNAATASSHIRALSRSKTDELVVYDTTRTGVARQPFCVWVLDNVGQIGVKRVKPEYKRRDSQGDRIPSQGVRRTTPVRL